MSDFEQFPTPPPASGHAKFNGFNGETEDIVFTLDSDFALEPDEEFFIDLVLEGTPATVVIGDAEGKGTIRNDDAHPLFLSGAVDFFLIETEVVEGTEGGPPFAGTAFFVQVVYLGPSRSEGFSVTPTLTHIDTAASDFVNLSQSLQPLTFSGADGEVEGFWFYVAGDAFIEGNEKFEIDLEMTEPVDGVIVFPGIPPRSRSPTTTGSCSRLLVP